MEHGEGGSKITCRPMGLDKQHLPSNQHFHPYNSSQFWFKCLMFGPYSFLISHALSEYLMWVLRNKLFELGEAQSN